MISYILKLSITGYMLVRRVNGEATNYIRPSDAVCRKLLLNGIATGDAVILHFARNDDTLMRRYISIIGESNV